MTVSLKLAHLILSYTPISKSFQAPKCVIKAKDSHLHQISVAILGFLTADPIPEGVPLATLPLQHTREEAIPSYPIIKEEEEEKEEEIVDVSDLEGVYEVFNQPLSLKISTGDLGQPLLAQSSHHQEVTSIPGDMGIQRKPRSTLLGFMP